MNRIVPGAVFYGDLAATRKWRPWLILWVDWSLDNDRGAACVAPLTSRGEYVGAISTGSDRFRYVGAWAMVQPVHVIRAANFHSLVLPAADLVRIRRELFKQLTV